jgi:hypothetical protein
MDESLWYTADWDLWIKLGGIGGAGLWSQPFTAFRLHGHSQTIRGAARAESMFMQTETVRARHLSRIADPRTRHAVNRAGRLASELNATLATAVGRRSFRCRGLWAGLAGLGLRGAFRFARDARILERSIARLRIGLHSPPTVS